MIKMLLLLLLQSPAAIAWNSFLIADGMAGSTLYLFWLSHKEKLPTPSEHNWEFFIALLLLDWAQSTIRVSCWIARPSLSKLNCLWLLTQDCCLLGSVIALWIIVNLLMNYTFIIQATTVKQSYFCSSVLQYENSFECNHWMYLVGLGQLSLE
jgi:hypothetical protein